MNIQSTLNEYKCDIDELLKFKNQSNRNRVKEILVSEISKLESLCKGLESQLSHTVKQENLDNLKPILNYSFDQTNSHLKIYLSLSLFKTFSKEPDDVKVNFSKNRTFTVIVDKSKLTIANFYGEIDTDLKNCVKITKDYIVITLKKIKEEHWPSLKVKEDTLVDKKVKDDDKLDQDDPFKSLMGIMRKMYDEGDDDTKRMIKKAWYESSKKQNINNL